MITIRRVRKSFRLKSGIVTALEGVDLLVEKGQFSVLLGQSGSGKTTLLRCVAGLEQPDAGEVILGAKTVYSDRERILVPPEERGIGMVFQSYAIWPHMTVFDNVALPLIYGRKKTTKTLVKEKVERALSLVSMEGLGPRPASLLSGGQQQRVALARALAIEPQVLLMDEPLSNLDARLREEIRFEIKALVQKIGVTVLHVTHDQAEAMALADVIAVMHQGKILQIGPPGELYLQPAAPFVADFFGHMNWLRGTVVEPGVVETEIGMVRVAGDRRQGKGEHLLVGIRPEDLGVDKNVSSDGLESNVLVGDVVSATFLGDHRMYKVRVKDQLLTVRSFDQLDGKVGVRLPPHKVHLFASPGSNADERKRAHAQDLGEKGRI